MEEIENTKIIKSIYIKYKPFIKNDLLYFTDIIFDYFDCTVPDKHEIAVLKIKDNYNNLNNKIDIMEIDNFKYIIGFLYPSESMEKENTYNFKPFWIYKNRDKMELRLSSFTIVNDITIEKKNPGGNYGFDNIKDLNFNKRIFNDIDYIFIIKVKNMISVLNT